MSEMRNNEEIHNFFSDKPEDETHTHAYQQGFNDGLRIGLDKGILMLNEFLNTYLHSVMGEMEILKFQEKIDKLKEG